MAEINEFKGKLAAKIPMAMVGRRCSYNKSVIDIFCEGPTGFGWLDGYILAVTPLRLDVLVEKS